MHIILFQTAGGLMICREKLKQLSVAGIGDSNPNVSER